MSQLEEQVCVFKISAIFKMAAKTRKKNRRRLGDFPSQHPVTVISCLNSASFPARAEVYFMV